MYFRAISCPRFRAEAASPSLVEGASRMGRQLRRWALAARVTVVSAMPQASLPRVLPVQGAMISRSSRPLGPMGSASFWVAITRWSQMRSISRIRSWAVPNRVSVSATTSETMGMTWSYRAFTASRASMALWWVQKEPHTANPTVLCSILQPSFPDITRPARGACCRWCSEWRRQR